MLYFIMLIIIALVCLWSIIQIKFFKTTPSIVFNFGIILILCFYTMILYDKNLQTSYDQYLRDCEATISKDQKCELESINFKAVNKRV